MYSQSSITSSGETDGETDVNDGKQNISIQSQDQTKSTKEESYQQKQEEKQFQENKYYLFTTQNPIPEFDMNPSIHYVLPQQIDSFFQYMGLVFNIGYIEDEQYQELCDKINNQEKSNKNLRFIITYKLSDQFLIEKERSILNHQWYKQIKNLMKNKLDLQDIQIYFTDQHQFNKKQQLNFSLSYQQNLSLKSIAFHFSGLKNDSSIIEFLQGYLLYCNDNLNITQLSINFSKVQFQNSIKIMELLTQIIVKISDQNIINYITFDFSQSQGVNPQKLSQFLSDLLTKSKLKKLVLLFDETDYFNDLAFEGIFPIFSGLSQINYITISLNYCQKLTYKGFKSIYYMIKQTNYQKSMQQTINYVKEKFIINLKGSEATDEKGINYFRKILNFKKTNYLNWNLDFSENSCLQDSTIDKLLNKGFKNLNQKILRLSLTLKNLKQLDNSMLESIFNFIAQSDLLDRIKLKLSKYSSNIIDLGKCFDILKNQNKLSATCLVLKFQNCSFMNDRCLETLKDVLSKFENLQKWNFSILNCQQISDTGLQYLAQCLPQLQVNILKLQFGNQMITTLGIKHISDGLMEYYKNLKQKKLGLSTFKLKICNSANLNDESIRHISSIIDINKLNLIITNMSKSQIKYNYKVVLRDNPQITKVGIYYLLCCFTSSRKIKEKKYGNKFYHQFYGQYFSKYILDIRQNEKISAQRIIKILNNILIRHEQLPNLEIKLDNQKQIESKDSAKFIKNINKLQEKLNNFEKKRVKDIRYLSTEILQGEDYLNEKIKQYKYTPQDINKKKENSVLNYSQSYIDQFPTQAINVSQNQQQKYITKDGKTIKINRNKLPRLLEAFNFKIFSLEEEEYRKKERKEQIELIKKNHMHIRKEFILEQKKAGGFSDSIHIFFSKCIKQFIVEKKVSFKINSTSHTTSEIFSKEYQCLRKINDLDISLPFVDQLENYRDNIIQQVAGIKSLDSWQLQVYTEGIQMRYPTGNLLIIQQIFAQLLYRMSLLHKNRIAHSDIKPSNIVIGHDFQFYLIDFGSSSFIGEENNKNYMEFLTQFFMPKHFVQLSKNRGFTSNRDVNDCELGCIAMLIMYLLSYTVHQLNLFRNQEWALLKQDIYKFYTSNENINQKENPNIKFYLDNIFKLCNFLLNRQYYNFSLVYNFLDIQSVEDIQQLHKVYNLIEDFQFFDNFIVITRLTSESVEKINALCQNDSIVILKKDCFIQNTLSMENYQLLMSKLLPNYNQVEQNMKKQPNFSIYYLAFYPYEFAQKEQFEFCYKFLEIKDNEKVTVEIKKYEHIEWMKEFMKKYFYATMLASIKTPQYQKEEANIYKQPAYWFEIKNIKNNFNKFYFSHLSLIINLDEKNNDSNQFQEGIIKLLNSLPATSEMSLININDPSQPTQGKQKTDQTQNKPTKPKEDYLINKLNQEFTSELQTCIRKLTFEIRGIDYLTKVGLKEMGFYIEKNQLLRQINLNFSHTTSNIESNNNSVLLNESDFLPITEAMIQNQVFNKYRLSFSNCSFVGSQLIKQFLIASLSNNKITHFTLKISDSKESIIEPSHFGPDSFQVLLSQVRVKKEIVIIFDTCQYIQQKANRITQILKKCLESEMLTVKIDIKIKKEKKVELLQPNIEIDPRILLFQKNQITQIIFETLSKRKEPLLINTLFLQLSSGKEYVVQTSTLSPNSPILYQIREGQEDEEILQQKSHLELTLRTLELTFDQIQENQFTMDLTKFKIIDRETLVLVENILVQVVQLALLKKQSTKLQNHQQQGKLNNLYYIEVIVGQIPHHLTSLYLDLFNYLYSDLIQINNLDAIQFSFRLQDCSSFSSQSIIKAISMINQLKFKSVSYFFLGNNDFEASTLQIMCKRILTNFNLRHLEIGLQNIDESKIPSSGWKSLFKLIRQSVNIENLKLNLSDNKTVNDAFIENLECSIKKNISLKELQLILRNCNLTFRVQNNLMNIMSKLNSLKMEIDFYEPIFQIRNQAIDEYKIRREDQNQFCFKINFSNNQHSQFINEKEQQKPFYQKNCVLFSQIMSYISPLTLEIDLSQNISNERLHLFFHALDGIKQQDQLVNLKMNMSKCLINSQLQLTIFEFIKYMKSLQILTVDLSQMRIYKTRYFKNVIFKHFPENNLTNITLNLEDVGFQSTDVSSFYEFLIHQRSNKKDLNLNFGKNPWMFRQQVYLFFPKKNCQVEFNSISLRFSYLDDNKDNFLVFLKEMLLKVTMKKFKIDFFKCQIVDRPFIDEIENVINKYCLQINNLKFNFYSCDQLDPEYLQRFYKLLRTYNKNKEETLEGNQIVVDQNKSQRHLQGQEEAQQLNVLESKQEQKKQTMNFGQINRKKKALVEKSLSHLFKNYRIISSALHQKLHFKNIIDALFQYKDLSFLKHLSILMLPTLQLQEHILINKSLKIKYEQIPIIQSDNQQFFKNKTQFPKFNYKCIMIDDIEEEQLINLANHQNICFKNIYPLLAIYKIKDFKKVSIIKPDFNEQNTHFKQFFDEVQIFKARETQSTKPSKDERPNQTKIFYELCGSVIVFLQKLLMVFKYLEQNNLIFNQKLSKNSIFIDYEEKEIVIDLVSQQLEKIDFIDMFEFFYQHILENKAFLFSLLCPTIILSKEALPFQISIINRYLSLQDQDINDINQLLAHVNILLYNQIIHLFEQDSIYDSYYKYISYTFKEMNKEFVESIETRLRSQQKTYNSNKEKLKSLLKLYEQYQENIFTTEKYEIFKIQYSQFLSISSYQNKILQYLYENYFSFPVTSENKIQVFLDNLFPYLQVTSQLEQSQFLNFLSKQKIPI